MYDYPPSHPPEFLSVDANPPKPLSRTSADVPNPRGPREGIRRGCADTDSLGLRVPRENGNGGIFPRLELFATFTTATWRDNEHKTGLVLVDLTYLDHCLYCSTQMAIRVNGGSVPTEKARKIGAGGAVPSPLTLWNYR
jgi:hypothetical protein